MAPSWPPRRPQDGPKTAPSRPRRPQDGPKTTPSRFQIASERHLNFKTFQHAPKTALGPPRGGPRGPQEAPESSQGPPRGSREAPKRPPIAPKKPPRESQEPHGSPRLPPKLQQHTPRRTHPTLNYAVSLVFLASNAFIFMGAPAFPPRRRVSLTLQSLVEHMLHDVNARLHPTASTTADQLCMGVAGDAPQALSIRPPSVGRD